MVVLILFMRSEIKSGKYLSLLTRKFKGYMMSKGDSKRGNKEAKKPKQEKPKVLATANSNAGKAPLNIGGKKLK